MCTCIYQLCMYSTIYTQVNPGTHTNFHTCTSTSTVHRHSGPRLTCGQTLVLENLYAASSSRETPHNVALPDWGTAICGRYRQQKIQIHMYTHHAALCSSGTYSFGAGHGSTSCSVSPFTVMEWQGDFLRRHWTSCRRLGGTPDTSATLMWGFSDSPVHTHRVSSTPGEILVLINGW